MLGEVLETSRQSQRVQHSGGVAERVRSGPLHLTANKDLKVAGRAQANGKEWPIEDVLVGFGISALDGTRVVSSFSTDCSRGTFRLTPGWHRVVVDVDVTLLPRRYALDCSKIRTLGWAPRVPFEQGIDWTISWYADNRSWWQPIKTGEYLEYYRRHYRL